MKDVYLFGDLHANHRKMTEVNEFGNTYRPFRKVEEMNERLIENINRVVRPKDSLYLLGDVVFQKSISEPLLSRINGKKRLIVGNHDEITPNSYYSKYFSKILLWTIFEEFDFVATHIPIHHSCFRGMALNCHGHMHKDTIPDIRYMNVSAERVNYEPVHIEVVAKFAKFARAMGEDR
jgi:calcineurin-like phosphoesterase family protein